MKHRIVVAALIGSLLTPLSTTAQNPVGESLQGLYDVTKTNVMATAQKLDQELYAFRPTDEVRSMGQLLAHIANAQFIFCSSAKGEANPNGENFEESRTTKASIIEALQEGFAYCDGVYAETTDAEGAGGTTLFGNPNTVYGVLAFNSAHNYEHYGNLVTYMRINGIVPPSSGG